jgi:hypothetical protein
MFALDALVHVYPDARFLWCHRDPAEVLASVCSLIHYTRSWSSDRDDAAQLGREMTDRWWEAVRRAMDFRSGIDDARFADVAFSSLQTDPISALAAAYARIGIDFTDESRTAAEQWASSHQPGAHGTHEYTLDDFGITAEQVRNRFAPYIETFSATG